MKAKYLLLAVVLGFAVGCGENQSLKDKLTGQPTIPTSTQSQLMSQFGSFGYANPFGPRQVGMVDGVGQERVKQQMGQTTLPYPSTRQWHARIEFVKADGSAVDQATFGTPLGRLCRIKISLINDAAPTVRYNAETEVYVLTDPAGAIMNKLGVTTRVHDANGTALYDISFGLGMGTGPMLGLGQYDGAFFGGPIVLEDASGKHIIEF